MDIWGRNLFNRVTGNKVAEPPQPETIDVDVDDESDDLHAFRFTSAQSRRVTHDNHKEGRGMTSGTNRTDSKANFVRRSERASTGSQPFLGQGGSRTASDTMYNSSANNNSHKFSHGSVRPRNDLLDGKKKEMEKAGQIRRKDRQGEQSAIDDHISKRRRIEIEGDGYERSESFSSFVDEPRRPPALRSSVGNNRRTFKRGSQKKPIVADDIEDDTPSTGNTFRRGSHVFSEAQSKTTNPLTSSRQPDSRGSSPDPLGSGPDGSYDSVHYVTDVGRARKVANVRSPQQKLKVQSGYELKYLVSGRQHLNAPDLYLVVQSGGLVYHWHYRGEEQGPLFRLKNVDRFYYHTRVPIVALQHSERRGDLGSAVVFKFKSEKDHIGFLQGLIPNINIDMDDMTSKSEADYLRWSGNVIESVPRGGQPLVAPELKNDSEASIEAPAMSTLNRPTSRPAKLKDKLTSQAGETREYVPGEIDATMAKVRKPLFKNERRSARISSQGYTVGARSYLDREPTPPSAPPFPESERYSRKVGLGATWKHELIYPRVGKNRATVYHHDLEKLDEGEFLNDNLINFHLRFLEDDLQRRQPEIARRVYWFNTYFYTTLVSGPKSGKGINYEGVKKWTRNVDVFNFDYIVVPIVENLHWYVAIICNTTAIPRGTPDFMEGLEQDDQDDKAADAELLELDDDIPDQASEFRSIDVSAPTMQISDGDANGPSSSYAPAAQLALEGSPPVDSIFARLDDYSVPLSNGAGNGSASTSPGKEGEADDVKAFIDGLEKHSAENAVSIDDEIQVFPEAIDEIAKIQHTPKGSLRKKLKTAPPIRRYSPDTPAIVTLDSLGVSHSNTVAKLKAYLAAEAADKRGNMEIDLKEIRGLTAQGIPVQENFVDCGLYLLGYVQKFVQGPRDFATGLLQKTFDSKTDWPLLDASKMRNSLRDIIFKQYTLQEDIRKAEKIAKKGKAPPLIANASSKGDTGITISEDASIAPANQNDFEPASSMDLTSRLAADKPLDNRSNNEGHMPVARASDLQGPLPTQDATEPVRSHADDRAHHSKKRDARQHVEEETNGEQSSDDQTKGWERREGSPPQLQDISVTVPISEHFEGTLEVPETPQPSPPPLSPERTARGEALSPRRPGTRGKDTDENLESVYFPTRISKSRKRSKQALKAPPVFIDLSD